MPEAPKVKYPLRGFPTPNRVIYLDNLVRTSEWELALLELNMGVTIEQAKAMPQEELQTWLNKLFWLKNQVENGFSRYDVCKEMYGFSYDQVIAMSPEEFKEIMKPVNSEFFERRHKQGNSADGHTL